MSVLFTRLKHLFDTGHGMELPDIGDESRFAPPNPRPAAVLIAVTERDEPGVLLINRPQTMRQHAGQVAFPGGKLDPGEDAVQAALREAEEELSLVPRSVRIIGSSDRYITGSGFAITPVLATIAPDMPIIPNPEEVDGWFEAPLRHILDPANHVQKTRQFNGRTHPYIEIAWQEQRIWGITAAIIVNLSRRLAWDKHRDG